MTCPACGHSNASHTPRCVECDVALIPADDRHSASTVLVRHDEISGLLDEAPADVREALTAAGATLSNPIRPPSHPPAEPGAAPAKRSAPPRRLNQRHALSVVIRDAEDEVLDVVELPEGTTFVGRREGNLRFPEDSEMSPLHARLAVGAGGRIRVRDLESRNGTWRRVVGQRALVDGDAFLVASQRFTYHESWGGTGPAEDGTSPPAPRGWPMPHRLVAYGPGGAPVQVHLLEEDFIIGREGRSPYQGDPRMARRHAQVAFTTDGAVLRDLSSGGVYGRIHGDTEVFAGDILLMGTRRLMLRAPE